jgi:two-component sensor histidine kinase
MEWAEDFSDSFQLAQSLRALGQAYYFDIDSLVKNDLPVDEKYELPPKSAYERSAEIFNALGDSMEAAQSLGKIGDIYNIQKKADQSLPYYLAFYEKAKRHGTPYQLMTACIQVGSGYSLLAGKENLLKALTFLKEGEKMAQEQGFPHEQLYCKEAITEIYEELGDYKSAFDYQNKWLVFQDSISGLEKEKQLKELETKYETEKKELTIASQQAELVKKRRTQSLTLIGLGLLALVAFLLYRTAAIRRKSNLELERRNAEIESQKFQIEEKSRQNEMLVREIHHRVKNNLQVITSLLHLQSMHIEDEAALDAVKEGQSRVKSMALLHQNLYQGDNLASIEMQEYVGLLLKSIGSAFGLRPNSDEGVRLVNEVTKQDLDVDLAIPLGLIINELVTNSLKYAFPDDRPGAVKVSLKKMEDGHLCLQVSDDGVGLSKAAPSENSTSFGTKLMGILTKKLKGEMDVVEDEGTSTKVYFSEKTTV